MIQCIYHAIGVLGGAFLMLSGVLLVGLLWVVAWNLVKGEFNVR